MRQMNQINQTNQPRNSRAPYGRTYSTVRPERCEMTVSLEDIRELCFSLRETALYLDNHPCDTDALAYFKKNACLLKAAKAEYEATVGPITWNVNEDCDIWSWVTSPWPWEL